MRRLNRLARSSAVMAVLVCALAFPAAVSAHSPGEVGDLGDTQSISDVTVRDGRASFYIDYPHLCPTGITACWVDYQFQYKCPEAWCGGFTSQGWRRLTGSGDNKVVWADCNGWPNEDNHWQIVYRIGWSAPTTKKVTISGEYEGVLDFTGSVGFRIIAEAIFNWTNNAGVKGTYTIETTTATADYSPSYVVATSGGRVLHTC